VNEMDHRVVFLGRWWGKGCDVIVTTIVMMKSAAACENS
jgi:hypothetical protein